MHLHVRSALIAASLAIVVSAAATAKSPMASALWNGTWQLNLAKSKLSMPVGQRSETRIYVVQGNTLKLTATGTDPSGKPTKYSYSGNFDGKPSPMIGNPVGDNISIRLVNPRRLNITVRMGKAITAVSRSDISPDGKHLTMVRKTLHDKAAPTVEMLVFDKQ